MFAFLFVLYTHRISEFEGNLETPWFNPPSNPLTKVELYENGNLSLEVFQRGYASGVLSRATTAHRTDFCQELGLVGSPSQVEGASLSFPEPPHSWGVWLCSSTPYKPNTTVGRGSLAFLVILVYPWATSFCLSQVFQTARDKIRTMKMHILFCSLFLSVNVQLSFPPHEPVNFFTMVLPLRNINLLLEILPQNTEYFPSLISPKPIIYLLKKTEPEEFQNCVLLIFFLMM